ncbi:MAG: ATP-binding protein [Deltaproteobacteria bacterium]
MKKARPILNYLVIAIAAFITAVTGALIHGSLRLKDRIISRTDQNAATVSGLIARSSIDLMAAGHGADQYMKILSYGGVAGVEDIALFNTDGVEAFAGEGPSSARRIGADEKEGFEKAVSPVNPAGSFSRKGLAYSHYAPIRSGPSCAACHGREGAVIGALRIRLSAADDFELPGYLKKLTWSLWLVILLPAGALLAAGAIIAGKNRSYTRLAESSSILRKTYNDLRGAEYYLQMILDNSKAVIVTTNTNGRIVEFNKEAERLLEYTKGEAAGMDVLALYENPRQRPGLMNGADAAGADVWAVRNRDVTLRSKSGKVLHVSLTLSTMVNDGGEIIGTVGIGKDVTEQRMLQFKLMQSEKLAGIGTLASGIAHEINNPLAGIMGTAEAIKDENDIDAIKSYTDDIIRYSIDAGNIVRELSSYSRPSRNDGTSAFELGAVIEHSLKMARHSAPLSSIRIASHLQKDCFINASKGELQQVFINLMVNAIHAMGGSGRLTLKCLKEGDLVKASVEDTGCGIKEEDLGKIFDPFFTTKPVGKGTGLGLYVVYRIVTRHGGAIDVESKTGKGTVFTLKFPASADAGDSAASGG